MVLDEVSELGEDWTMFILLVLFNATDTACRMRSESQFVEMGKIATQYEFLIVSCFERIKFIY